MNLINIQYCKTRIGELILGSYAGRLCLMDFRYRKMRPAVDNRIKKGLAAEFREQNDEIIAEAIRQLEEYLAGHRTAFDIPVLMIGTDFQKDVWRALTEIPYGKTVTYTELAKAIKQENAVRAVAGANGANAIAIIIPCHRVIGSSGELTGYGGGLSVKKRLLKLERNNSVGQLPKSIF
ncbi:MAG TPA: methylated-DNA--[protein]-cysteine S-methyltransferase [Bacteroidales bacterium]|nr:methylated-DNA--[protein]-cysteine S-methyltransferase [Bacteroidales bacterium]HNR43397.1 methylated-DNA--[protein]-cysteine S-methyltransferase [Bacteroidales bacterium]HPM17373.1 methylated-DNA--[protein]-cysteine S-methyltransferase [Bacteroidales bacterium]HQG56386.1 methylated-DNA--[protein]-cysteine S-methyltransferase [Bacteroidales bacterium]HQG78238.1 methylated-DNA--[protein]-cysteine S-methyltransferase [Bacteroidales bacterium]